MTRAWRIHVEAQAELAGAAAWYERQRAGLGLEFLAALRHALAAVDSAPGASARDADVPRVQRRRLPRFPHVVVFVDGPTERVVLAVMHPRRRPGYWRDRVEE